MPASKTPLRKAVDYLIAKGKINADKDLQEIFGLSKGTISKYLNETPGKQFLKDFETKFEIKVDGLPGLQEPQPANNNHALMQEDDYRKKYEQLLEKINAEQSATIQGILKRIDANLNDAAYNQHVFRIMTTERQRVALENIALLRDLTRHELVHEADSIAAARLDEYEKMHTDVSDTIGK